MRVLHVLEVDHGGVVTYVRALAQAQLSQGIDVHVLAPSAAGHFGGIRHYWEPRRRSPIALCRAFFALHRVTSETKPSVVHLHSFFAGLLGRMGRLDGGVVYQPHSWAFHAVPSAGRAVVTAVERIAKRRTEATVVNCADEIREAEDCGLRGGMEAVGVPVDLALFSPEALQLASTEQSDDEARVLLCVGRISSQKGQVELARQWELAPIPGACLTFVGPGDGSLLESAAPSSFGKSLLWAGPTSDVRPFLAQASVTVLPSRYEGQSVAMAESLASGVPVVMTDVNGARAAIQPDGARRAGAVVPRGDLAGLLAQAALRLADDDLRSRESHAARQTALDQFDVKGVADRVEKVYRRAAATKPQARRG